MCKNSQKHAFMLYLYVHTCDVYKILHKSISCGDFRGEKVAELLEIGYKTRAKV